MKMPSSMNQHLPPGAEIAPEELDPICPAGVAPDAGVGLMPLLATGLAPVAPREDREALMRRSLFDRVSRSAARHRAFVTARRQEGPWLDLQPGIQQRQLHGDEASHSVLLQWSEEADLTLPPGAHVHECLVLRGELQAEGQVWRAQDYLLAPGEAQVWRASPGTCVYWRRVDTAQDDFGQPLRAPHGVHAQDLAWSPLRQGVRIKPLYTQDDRVSMLVSFDAGASVPAHEHAHGEACLMVEGDLFLGDVLLRQGDFQFAPKGSDHGELSSDVGCLLYFHGAIDPSVVDPAVQAA